MVMYAKQRKNKNYLPQHILEFATTENNSKCEISLVGWSGQCSRQQTGLGSMTQQRKLSDPTDDIIVNLKLNIKKKISTWSW